VVRDAPPTPRCTRESEPVRLQSTGPGTRRFYVLPPGPAVSVLTFTKQAVRSHGITCFFVCAALLRLRGRLRLRLRLRLRKLSSAAHELRVLPAPIQAHGTWASFARDCG
jgi:hypothetical protein